MKENFPNMVMEIDMQVQDGHRDSKKLGEILLEERSEDGGEVGGGGAKFSTCTAEIPSQSSEEE